MPHPLPELSSFRRYVMTQRLYTSGPIALRTALLRCPRELTTRLEIVGFLIAEGLERELRATIAAADRTYRIALEREDLRARRAVASGDPPGGRGAT